MIYSKEIIKHFRSPKNLGTMKNPDSVGEAGNTICGDMMKIYIKVKNGRISDIKGSVFGCVVAIANTSLLTTMVKGKKIEEALKIKKEDLIKKLGKVPPIKVHCSVLALDALREAIYDFLKKNKMKIPKELEKDHKRILETTKNIEKMHKDFVKFQRGLMK